MKALRRLEGLGGALLALAGGLLAGLAHPPFGLSFIGLFGFAALLFALDKAPTATPLRSAFLRGWLAGFAYFLVGTWWVGEAFMVDVAAHGWQAPFAVILLPAGLGLFWGLAGLVYRLIAPPGARRLLVFAAVFSVMEWTRGHVLTGFPWNLPGESWRAGSAPSQAAAVIGAYGLTFVSIAIGAFLGLRGDTGRERAIVGALGVLTVAGLFGGGHWRLSQPAPPDTSLRIRIVQPDIPQEAKWTPESFTAIVNRYIALTERPAANPPQVVIWPETAIPADAAELLAPNSWVKDEITEALPPGSMLLTGMFRTEGGRYYNSLFALRRDPGGLTNLGVYDKHRLVPFGEYLPLEDLLTRLGLKQLTAMGESFSSGPAPGPLTPSGLPAFQPLICYESLFPDFPGARGPRPAWIVNVSNDAWFGRTSGPWQHLNLASYRAIESGLPIVRSTPTGVSAVVDGYGRLQASLPLGERGVIDATLPGALPPTPYMGWRDLPFWILCALGLACALRRGGRPRRV